MYWMHVCTWGDFCCCIFTLNSKFSAQFSGTIWNPSASRLSRPGVSHHQMHTIAKNSFDMRGKDGRCRNAGNIGLAFVGVYRLAPQTRRGLLLVVVCDPLPHLFAGQTHDPGATVAQNKPHRNKRSAVMHRKCRYGVQRIKLKCSRGSVYGQLRPVTIVDARISADAIRRIACCSRCENTVTVFDAGFHTGLLLF